MAYEDRGWGEFLGPPRGIVGLGWRAINGLWFVAVVYGWAERELIWSWLGE